MNSRFKIRRCKKSFKHSCQNKVDLRQKLIYFPLTTCDVYTMHNAQRKDNRAAIIIAIYLVYLDSVDGKG